MKNQVTMNGKKKLLTNTAHEIANEIMMQRTFYDNMTFVLLEGPTDVALYTEFLSNKYSKLIPTHNVEKAIKAVDILEIRKVERGIIAIVDADFRILEQEISSPNVIFTDMSDAEMMLINSPSFFKVLRHTISFHEISSVKTQDLPEICYSLVESAIDLCLPLGYLRWVGHKNPHYNFSYKNFSFSDIINFRKLTIDQEKLFVSVAHNVEPFIEIDTLESEIEALKEISTDGWKICRGHDLLAVIAYIIEDFFKIHLDYQMSKKEKIQTASQELSRSLRIAYEKSYFQDTLLYKLLKEWENANSPYRLFDNV